MLPTIEVPTAVSKLPSAVFVISWIVLSTVTILFNKYILSNLEFHFPAILTCWHMGFASLMTQILARYTSLVDSRKSVKMTGRIYLRAIVPIGVLYSASLVCSNQVYLYLSVAFVQMLKASAPAAVLLISWSFRVAQPSLEIFINITIIVFGVTLASLGEVKFNWIGFFYQLGGIFSEGVRLIMIQILLSGEGQAMDPLVSLYYYAPVCTIANFLVAAATEFGAFGMADVWRAGVGVLILNAAVAFALNVSRCVLGLVMTLCGVLKNILLVVASVVIWGTIITGMQFFGYAIALSGLVYYGVGYEGIMIYWAVTTDFISKLLGVKGETLIGNRSGSLFISKMFWFGLWVFIAGTLMVWIIARSGTAQGVLDQVKEKAKKKASHH